MNTVSTLNQTGPALGFDPLSCTLSAGSLSYGGKIYAHALTIAYKFSRSDRSPPMTCVHNLQRNQRRIPMREGGREGGMEGARKARCDGLDREVLCLCFE